MHQVVVLNRHVVVVCQANELGADDRVTRRADLLSVIPLFCVQQHVVVAMKADRCILEINSLSCFGQTIDGQLRRRDMREQNLMSLRGQRLHVLVNLVGNSQRCLRFWLIQQFINDMSSILVPRCDQRPEGLGFLRIDFGVVLNVKVDDRVNSVLCTPIDERIDCVQIFFAMLFVSGDVVFPVTHPRTDANTIQIGMFLED